MNRFCRTTFLQAIKGVLISLILSVLLLGLLELGFRISGLGKPSLRTAPLAEESAGLLQFDRELFWVHRPGFRGTFIGGQVSMNRLGLRGSEVCEKGTNEFRILSLGESSTFGLGVSDEETYSAYLEKILNQKIGATSVKVLNAGVSAYSSFQSLKYLEERGLKLKPDLVVFSHELNDYLPSSLRDSSQNEVGVTRTDKQLYESRVRQATSLLMERAALFRFLTLREAKRRIRQFNTNDFVNPLSSIGIADINLSSFPENICARHVGRFSP